MYDEDGDLVGTAVTNENGEYYFVSTISQSGDANRTDSVGGGLESDAAFTLRLDNPDDYRRGGPLSGLIATRADANDPTRGTSDRIDSDARRSGGYPTILVNPLLPGNNNHDFDVGFTTEIEIDYTLPIPTTTIPMKSDLPTVD